MATTYIAAVDRILTIIRAKWLTDAAALNGAVLPELVFEDLQKDLKPAMPKDETKAWARVTIRHQGGMATAIGNRKFRRTGMVWVQCFVPATDGLARTVAQALAALAQEAYESATGEVSFKNATVAEKNPDGLFARADCTADFWWDQVRTS